MKPILVLVVAFCILLLILPTIIVFATSFTESEIVTFPPKGFTLRWYFELAVTGWFLRTFLNSLYAATFCTILSVPVGVLTALALNRYKVRAANLLQVYLLLPFTIPLIVSGIGLLFIYARLGWLGSIWAVGFALMVINIPFMIWGVGATINSLDPNLEHAAQSLGAEEIQTFLFVTLPSLTPGIISGALLMFVLGLTEFITSMILVTLKSMTLPVALYTSIKTALTPLLASISSVYVVVAIVAVVLLDKVVGLREYLRMR